MSWKNNIFAPDFTGDYDGTQNLKNISEQLVEKFGAGFSEQNLRNMRQFYLKYSDRSSLPIRQTASSELPAFTLNWSHYLVLMRIENPDERRFYEIEASQQNWSERYFKR